MKNRKLKLLITVTVPIVAVLVIFLGAVLELNSSCTPYCVLNSNDEIIFSTQEEKVTTELIVCGSNNYTKINIHRNYGIPRFGIITDCAGQTSKTKFRRLQFSIMRLSPKDCILFIFMTKTAKL